MSSINEQRSLPDLIKELFNDLTLLFRKEVQLAKAEAGEKVGQFVGGAEMVIVAAVLGIAAIGVLLTAAVAGVAALFVAMGMQQSAATGLSALVVGGIVGIAAYVLFKRGMSQLKARNLMLDRTAESLQRDAAVIREKTHA